MVYICDIETKAQSSQWKWNNSTETHSNVEKPIIFHFHYNNALADTSFLVSEFFTKNKTIIMPQPSYLPDLVIAGFFLFPNLKTRMKEKRFATIEEIIEKSKQELLAIPTIPFHNCFEA